MSALVVYEIGGSSSQDEPYESRENMPELEDSASWVARIPRKTHIAIFPARRFLRMWWISQALGARGGLYGR